MFDQLLLEKLPFMNVATMYQYVSKMLSATVCFSLLSCCDECVLVTRCKTTKLVHCCSLELW